VTSTSARRARNARTLVGLRTHRVVCPLWWGDTRVWRECGSRCADRALYISQLPEVLCIHVKRFNYSHMWGSKVSTTVTFPLEGLDMSPFLRSLIVPPEPSPSSGTSTTASSSLAGGEAGDTVFSSPLPTSKVHAIMPSGVPAREDIVSRDSTVYDLVSVVEHIGSLHGASTDRALLVSRASSGSPTLTMW
jgi:hypothetical protein